MGNAIGIEALGVNAAQPTVLILRAPAEYQITIGELGNDRLVLDIHNLGIDEKFAAHRGAIGIETLRIHSARVPILAV